MPRAPRPNAARAEREELFRGRGAAFLVSQLGAQVSRAWSEHVRPLGLDVREAMLLWHAARKEGRSQRELADALGLPESRIVGLVDVLEGHGLVERRTDPRDRRARQLNLTAEGHAVLDRLMEIAATHEAWFTEGLSREERQMLIEVLDRIATRQGVRPAVHPDF
jgi:DNA-binding MarR family transcriptional regulator